MKIIQKNQKNKIYLELHIDDLANKGGMLIIIKKNNSIIQSI